MPDKPAQATTIKRCAHCGFCHSPFVACREETTAARVLVPREATPAMVRAALDRPHGADLPTLYHGIWAAMVAAVETEATDGR